MTTQTTETKRRGNRKPYEGPTAEEKLCTALADLMARGVNPWRQDWRGGSGGGRHRNLITGQPYRGSNPAVLAMWQAARGYSLPLWVGIAQAKQKGWFPRKGSQGCYVLRPQLNKREDKDDNGETRKGPDGLPLISAWVSYKPACVFNVADLKGGDDASEDALKAAIAAAAGAPILPEPDRLANAESVLAAWPVETVWAGHRACYSPLLDTISMPDRNRFATAEGLYATWAHEQAHSTGHNRRLSRDLTGIKGDQKYAREELVAELAAYLICNRLEISSNTENHAAYLTSWAKVIGDGPKVLFKVLSDATKAANMICGPEVEPDA